MTAMALSRWDALDNGTVQLFDTGIVRTAGYFAEELKVSQAVFRWGFMIATTRLPGNCNRPATGLSTHRSAYESTITTNQATIL